MSENSQPEQNQSANGMNAGLTGAPSPEELEAAQAANEFDALCVAQAEVATLTAKNTELADSYLRAKAEAENARRRAEELSARLKQRTVELQAMRHVASGTPNVIGGALIIPAGLLALRSGKADFTADAAARARVERVAMQAVVDAEHALGHRTKDVSAAKCGWDITAYTDQPQGLALERHIEVKGRAKGQDTITVTSNEIRYGLNQKEKFVLAVVVVDGDQAESVNYIPMPFTQEPDWAEASKNLDLGLLLGRALAPKVFYG